jgi:phosphate transport system permease protein
MHEKQSSFGRRADSAMILLCGAGCLLIVGMLITILGNIVLNGAHVVDWTFLTGKPEEGMTKGGIFPAIFGTVALILLMTIAVVPLGTFGAIYMHEYAPKKSPLARLIRIAVNNLAGVPSIVFGLFGLAFFVEFIGAQIDRAVFGGELHYGQPAIIWAALTLAVLTLPVVIVSTEEALRAVPDDLRHAALAVGVTRWQMLRHIVLPQALPGVLTGAILAVSRGAGEVAPILFTGAAYFLPELPTRLNHQFMELGYHVYVMATQSPDVEATKPLLYGTVLVLLTLTFLLNVVAVLIRSHMRTRISRNL